MSVRCLNAGVRLATLLAVSSSAVGHSRLRLVRSRRNNHASRGTWEFIAAAAPAGRPHLTTATVRAQLFGFATCPIWGSSRLVLGQIRLKLEVCAIAHHVLFVMLICRSGSSLVGLVVGQSAVH